MKITFITSSFDANLCNPRNANTMSRFSSIIRRFLCSGSLRTHPFDCVKEPVPVLVEPGDQTDFMIEKMEGSVTPGIVARLMGLETMPEFDSVPTKRISKDSIRRSRSVSSAGYWSEFDHNDTENPRRVKSFREIPSFLNQEDDEFLVLSFEDLKEKKPKKSCKELKQMREGGTENKENRRFEHSSKDSSHKYKINHRKSHTSTNPKTPSEAITKKKEEFQKDRCGVIRVEGERSSENSSPVSVLDLIEFASEPESPLSEEDSRSRRKLSTELAIPDQQSSNFSEVIITEEGEAKSISPQVANSTKKLNSHSEDCLGGWEDVCKFAEDEVQTSNWITREIPKMQDFEEIRIEFGLNILDHLLYEFVRELL